MLNNLLAGLSAGAIADIVVAVIFLASAISGLFKGFLKQTFGLLTTIIAFVLAYVLCDDLVGFLNSSFGWTDKLAGKLADSFSGNEFFSLSLSEENLAEAVKQMGLPSFMADLAVKLLPSAVGEYENIGLFLSSVLANYILIAAAFVVLFIIVKLLLALLKQPLLKIVKLPILRSIDRILGLVCGAIKGVLWIISIAYIISIIPASFPYIGVVKESVTNSQFVAFLNSSGIEKIIADLANKLVTSILGK